VGPDVPCAGYDSAVAFELRLEYAVCGISSMSLDALCGIRIHLQEHIDVILKHEEEC
jgi:hypothetical protein